MESTKPTTQKQPLRTSATRRVQARRVFPEGIVAPGTVVRTDLEVSFKIIVAPEVVLLELGPKDGRRCACRSLHHPVSFHNLNQRRQVQVRVGT